MKISKLCVKEKSSQGKDVTASRILLLIQKVDNFEITSKLKVFELDELIFSQTWDFKIPRKWV